MNATVKLSGFRFDMLAEEGNPKPGDWVITVSPYDGAEKVIHGAYVVESVREVKQRQASRKIRWAVEALKSTVTAFRSLADRII